MGLLDKLHNQALMAQVDAVKDADSQQGISIR
jgi:hypothetical protein